MDSPARIASVDAVPPESTFVFTVREVETGEEKEAILVGLDDDVAAWLNYCQHFTHIKLDKGSGAEIRDGEVICTNHGAYFESDTGRCSFGPCEGAYLTEVSVSVEDDSVFLTDDAYEFVQAGPMETDELDLTSKSNFEF